MPALMMVSTITGAAGSTYDGVVFSTTVFIAKKLAIGETPADSTFVPTADLHLRGNMRLEAKTGGGPIYIDFLPSQTIGFDSDSYIRWSGASSGNIVKSVLGVEGAYKDLVYRGEASSLENGLEIFRVKSDGRFIIGSSGPTFNPAELFRVLTHMSVSAPGQMPLLFVSTLTSSVGISTGTPKERAHVGSSFLVGGDRASAALYVSTQSGYTGVGTGNPQATLQVAGYALVNSSLTVTGTGVAGTEDLLNVKSGALLVRNDGRVGLGAASPETTLDVNGSAQFGSGVNKSTFTADGFWMPRSMDTLALQSEPPPAIGVVVFNSSINDLCVSTGTAVGQWALTGSKGLDNCFN